MVYGPPTLSYAPHPHVATTLNNLALLYYAIGEYEETLTLLVQAEKIFLEKLGENHPYTKSVIEAIHYIKEKHNL